MWLSVVPLHLHYTHYPEEKMIQPQRWPAVRQEFCRPLPLPSLDSCRDSLSDLAEAASNMGQAFPTSRSLSPESSSDHVSREYASPSPSFKRCSLPGFSELFSDVIAAADRRPDYYRQDGYAAPSFARRGSAGSEESRRGSLSSVPGLSPLSTAHTSPIISPTTPPASFSIPTKSQLQICLRLADYRDDQERQRRKLTQIRSRRTPSRHSLHGELDNQQYLGHTHSPNRAVHLYQHRHQQQRRQSPVVTTVPPTLSLPISTSSSTTTATATIEDARERKPHFNQKYKDPDKLFIVYHKEDQRWGWPAIVERRLQMLKDVLGPGYNPQVEEHRNVSGLNGMYYRQNELMSVLTPDGSGLVFAEKDGRWWELAKSQKCRAAAPDSNNNPTAASAGVRRGSGAGTAADTRPRGMVERYPEEVVHYWDPYVIKFIPKEKQAEVLARARRYCEIRAEQRRQHGVPPWSLDNREDRVLTIKEPKEDGPSNDDSTAANNDNSSPSTCRGRNARRSRRS